MITKKAGRPRKLDAVDLGELARLWPGSTNKAELAAAFGMTRQGALIALNRFNDEQKVPAALASQPGKGPDSDDAMVPE